MKKVILQQYFDAHLNNGGPATGAVLLMNSSLKEKYSFLEMSETHPSKEGYFKQFIYFYKTIKRIKPDLVHIRGVQLHGFWAVLAANLLNVKCVMSVNGLSIDCLNMGRIYKFLYQYILEPYALRHADLTYCVCKYAYERKYVRKHTKNLYGYIHNAAPIFDLQNRDNERIKKRNELGLSENDILITNIGRLTLDKGILVLVESFLLIKDKYPHTILCLAGEGDSIEIIKSKYKELLDNHRILLLGKISDVKETLLASDMFVFPTLHENLSNSLLEAATVGLPIIATNVGGNPEVVEHKKTGLLVQPNDSGNMAEAITMLLENEDLRNRLGKAAIEDIKKRFSQNFIFSQIDEMYQSILK